MCKVPALKSFAAETRVLMADGSAKPIAEISVGNMVYAGDPVTGEVGAYRVTAVWAHEDDVVDLLLSAGALATTEDHPFWSEDGQEWRSPGELEVGEHLRADGAAILVAGIADGSRRTVMAYNLTVENLHTYFVLAGPTPVLVHNFGCDVPTLDSTGKVHGELPPGNRVPSHWTVEELEQLESELVMSIKRRKEVNSDLGLDYGHAKRVADEEALLRDVRNKLNGK